LALEVHYNYCPNQPIGWFYNPPKEAKISGSSKQQFGLERFLPGLEPILKALFHFTGESSL
jgi:hypothetical protein